MGKKKKQSGGSLQSQLKNAGLVTDKQIRKAQKGIHRQEMRVKHGDDVDENRQAAEQALADKQIRDRQHNEALNQAAQARALQAQISQLINMNGQREDGEAAYNFTDGKLIKKIYVSEKNKKLLNQGYLAIVKSAESYQLVPAQVARKIVSRIPQHHEEVVLYLYDKAKDLVDEDDPYKDFQIPDDLDW